MTHARAARITRTVGPEVIEWVDVDLPDPAPGDVRMRSTAAGLLKGCTAEFLVDRAARIAPGDWTLVHAAAGGVGLLLVQWLKARGARVIGTTGTEDKAALARATGADEIIFYIREDTAKRVREITGGLACG